MYKRHYSFRMVMEQNSDVANDIKIYTIYQYTNLSHATKLDTKRRELPHIKPVEHQDSQNFQEQKITLIQ